MSQEYLLDEKNSRLTVHPIKEPEIWNFYKTMMAAFGPQRRLILAKIIMIFKNYQMILNTLLK